VGGGLVGGGLVGGGICGLAVFAPHWKKVPAWSKYAAPLTVAILSVVVSFAVSG